VPSSRPIPPDFGHLRRVEVPPGVEQRYRQRWRSLVVRRGGPRSGPARRRAAAWRMIPVTYIRGTPQTACRSWFRGLALRVD
jgi:hypothetical protein